MAGDKAPRAAGSAPIDLAILKDDLGIPPTDASNDAWLQRRVDAVWARMEAYTNRKLCSPPASFVDDWGELVIQHHHVNLPPAIAFPRRGSIFLRYYPVPAIEAVVVNDQDLDASKVRWDNASGKLLALNSDQAHAQDLGQPLIGGRARITYKAGWDELPADLYECLLGAVQVMWNARQSQGSGLGGGTVSRIAVNDVGDVEISPGNTFVAAATRGPGAADPILGPFAALLDDYVDLRNAMGAESFPTTKPAPVTP